MLSQTGIGCFLLLAETQSFTETARQLYMTQQAVSRHIAKLEEELGFTLFTRTRHSVSITKAGANFYELFSRFRVEFDVVTEATRKFYEDRGKTLNIAYLDWIAISAEVKTAVASLTETAPDLRFSTRRERQAQMNDLLSEGEIDCIITYEGFTAPGKALHTQTLCLTELVLLISKSNPLIKPGVVFSDLAGEPYIKPQEINEPEAEIMRKAKRECQELGLHPREIIVAPNIETAYTLAEMGQGVILSRALSRMASAGTFEVFKTGKQSKLICAWRSDEKSELLSGFIECLGKAFEPED